jgi:hypothetical protein
MAKRDRFKGFVIGPGPKPVTTRTTAEEKAIKQLRETRNKIDDIEFEKKLGISGELDYS